MGNKNIQVGLDIGKKKLDMCVQGSGGEVLVDHRTFSNSYRGYQALKKEILGVMQEREEKTIRIGGESTGYYWLPLFLELEKEEELAPYQPELHLLNARQMHWFKRCYARDDKTDAKDSFYIAEKLRVQPPGYVWQANLGWLRLRIYSRCRFQIGQNMTRMKNYFWSHMYLWCDRYGHKKPFGDGLGACGRKLVKKFPDWQTLRDSNPSSIGERLKDWSRDKLPNPVKHAQQLQDIIHQSYPLDPALAAALHTLLTLTIDHIQLLERQAADVEKKMKEEIRTHHPEVRHLMNIKGLGVVFAAGIASEIGDLQRFFQTPKWDKRRKRYRKRNLRDVEDAIAKYAGLWWPRKESGNFKGEERRMAKKGNRYLLYYLVEAADKLRQYLPEYQEYYQRKYRETKKYQHKRALVLTARKSIGLYLGLLHRDEPYRSPEERN